MEPSTWFILILVPIVIAVLDHASRRVSPKQWWMKKESMPKDLRSSQLYMSEKDIEIRMPVFLKGRVDQVFLTKEDLLVPVDTKLTYPRCVSHAEKIQLSGYRAILTNTEKYSVANYGYIRFVNRDTGKVHYRKVSLLPPEAIYRLVSEEDSNSEVSVYQ